MAGGPSRDCTIAFRGVGCECLEATNNADLINQVWELYRLPVLALGDAITLPENFLGPALRLIGDDLRVATVSFFSNDAGFLSFPVRNEPTSRPPEGHDVDSVTRHLREVGPYGPPTPIPTAVGAAVLLAPSALGAVGGLVSPPRSELTGAVADFAARARSKGFIHLLDDSTFYARHRAAGDAPPTSGPMTICIPKTGSGSMPPIRTSWVSSTTRRSRPRRRSRSPTAWRDQGIGHPRLGGCLVSRSARNGHSGLDTGHDRSPESPAGRAGDSGRAQDGHSGVRAKTLSLPEVLPRVVNMDTLEGLGRCDVAHRLVQPDQWFSVERWRTVADRVVVTILDLIGYRNGAYHESTKEWLVYRDALRSGAELADAVVVISEDVKAQVEMERLSIDPQRLHTIPFGTEHLTGDEVGEIPRELLARGFVEGQFVLCLGADYAHKNRDLALAVVAQLRQRGHAHALVMAGPTVPYGSSRLSEAKVRLHASPPLDSDVYVLPDLPSAERNWLDSPR